MIVVLIFTSTDQHASVSIDNPLILIHSDLNLNEKPHSKVLVACFSNRALLISSMPKKSKIKEKSKLCAIFIEKFTRFKHVIITSLSDRLLRKELF